MAHSLERPIREPTASAPSSDAPVVEGKYGRFGACSPIVYDIDDVSSDVYSTDGGDYRQDHTGVVEARSEQDEVQTLTAARYFGEAITMSGGGTSLAGQCCNVAIVIDCSKYLNRILDLDYQNRR